MENRPKAPQGNLSKKVNPDEIREGLSTNPEVSQFVQRGERFLRELNKPNVITLEQFRPFVELFKIDQNKISESSDQFDQNYLDQMRVLSQRYISELNINIQQPTLVVESKENPKEIYFLDRVYTRIKPDQVESGSRREKVVGTLSPRAMGTRQEELVMSASFQDLATANSTDAQKEYFKEIRRQSALVNKKFVDHNLSPEKRKELMGDKELPTKQESVSDATAELMDDDD